MNRERCRARLIELLHDHGEQICKANDYLLDIRTAIAENRIEQLQQSLEDPYFAIETIERLERQRHQLLQSHGFGSDDKAFTNCIAWCDDDRGSAMQAYQELVDQLLELRRSIVVNSLLIDKGRERVRRSIGILTGISMSAKDKTYSSDGKTVETSGQRNIATA